MKGTHVVSVAIASLLVYTLVEVLISPFVYKVYQFDTHRMFLSVFFSLLFVAVALMRVASKGRNWRLVLLGSVAGLLAGIATQLVILWMERYRFEVWSLSLVSEVIGSLLLMSAVLATPIWGVVVAVLASALIKGCRKLSKNYG
jgi:hypothetical protein